MKTRWGLIILIATLIAEINCGSRNRVRSAIQVQVQDLNDLDHVKNVIETGSDCNVTDDEFHMHGGRINLICYHDEIDRLEASLNNFAVTVKILFADLDEAVRSQMDNLPPPKPRAEPWLGRKDESFKHDCYLEFKDIKHWLHNFTKKYDFVHLVNIGRSHEDRPLHVVQIEHPEAASRPIIFIEAGGHSREWIGPAVALCLIEKLTRISNANDYLLNFRFHILPMLNPDGYVYTHKHDRFWSKNRRPDPECPGVNLNRNFPSYFGHGPREKCARSYVGSRAASEPEVAAVVDYFRSHLANRTAMAISLHCFGQVCFLPFAGDPDRKHPYLKKMLKMAKKSTHYIQPHYYRYGKVEQFLRLPKNQSQIGGTSMDFYAESGVPFSFTIELPDFGEYGFLLPPEDIPIICDGIVEGLRRMSEMLIDEFGDQTEIRNNVTVVTQPPTTTTTTTTPPPTTTTTRSSTSTTSTTTTTTTEQDWRAYDVSGEQDHTECCTSLELSSAGGALLAQPLALGRYVLNFEKTNGTHWWHVYKKVDDAGHNHYLFRYYLEDMYIWIIGPQVNQNYAYLVNEAGNVQCPENLNSPEVQLHATWFYINGNRQWLSDDSTITLTCTY